MKTDSIDTLRRLIDEERTALRAGKLANVAELAEKKQQIADQLAGSDGLDADSLRLLREAAERNRALLEAWTKGLMAARTRLGEVRRAVRHLDTYTSDGGRRDLIGAGTSVERRA